LNLAEFVEETLSEVLSGIRAAQKKEGGGAVGAEGIAIPPTQNTPLIFSGSEHDKFTVVEFDVSVLAETSKGGKGGLRVWSVGVEAGGKRSDQQTSRVRFAVHVKIPPGDKVEKLRY
jgi:hypothetical protein